MALTTELKREKTFFIPFNQGSNGAGEVGGAGNPEREDGGYVTAYLWEKVLQRDMLLSILQRYISRQEEEKLKIIIDKHGRLFSLVIISWMWWKSWWLILIFQMYRKCVAVKKKQGMV